MFQFGRWARGLFVKVGFQAVQNPPSFEAGLAHFGPSVIFRYAQEIDLIESGNQASPVSAQNTVYVHRLEFRVLHGEQNLIDVLARWRNGGSVHGNGEKLHAISLSFPLLEAGQEGEEPGVEYIADVLRLQEFKIFVGVRFGTDVNMFINFGEVVERGACLTLSDESTS